MPFIDVSAKVNDYWDRGLLGIAADPSFTTNGFVYLYYVFEHNAIDYSGPKTARLTRVTAVGDTASLSSEVVLLGSLSGPSCGGFPAGSDCIPADSPSHNGGAIRFASDNTMFLTTGDGASFTVVDDLALRAQSLTSLAGKVLHITRTGAGISTNPFWTGNAANVQSKIWARGVRNPFRMSLQPGTNQVYLGDVGWSAYEEVNVAIRGANLGWPCYEGPNRQGGYESKPVCQTLYASGPSAVQIPLTSVRARRRVVGHRWWSVLHRHRLPAGVPWRLLLRRLRARLDSVSHRRCVEQPRLRVRPPSAPIFPGRWTSRCLPTIGSTTSAINTGELRRIRYVGTSETRLRQRHQLAVGGQRMGTGRTRSEQR